jgi:hypothetical protein
MFKKSLELSNSIEDGIHRRTHEKVLDTVMDLFTTIPFTTTFLREKCIIALSLFTLNIAAFDGQSIPIIPTDVVI